jgi:hypothetical protein
MTETGAEPESRRALAERVMLAETQMTPRDYMKFMNTLMRRPGLVDDALLRENETRRFLENQRLTAFRRVALSDDVTLFRGRRGWRRRSLLVAVTAQLGRMTIPAPAFLQSLPAGGWDVLMLHDSARTHFRRGCAGFAGSFPALAARVAAMAARYRKVVIVGASIGGLTAIRLALKVPGARGVSVGGMPANDIDRMFREPAHFAFDPLCACLSARQRDLVFLFSDGHRRDRLAAQRYAGMTGGRAFPLMSSAIHGVFAELWRNGRLQEVLAYLTQDQADWPALRRVLATAVRA